MDSSSAPSGLTDCFCHCCTVSGGLRCGCQCSGWERPRRRTHGAGQAVKQGLPLLCRYVSIIQPEEVCSCPPANGCGSNSFNSYSDSLLYFFSLVSMLSTKTCPFFLTSIAALFSCVFGACLGVSKDVIGYIFTTEE